MGNNSAGTVPGGNEGKTDMDRGSVKTGSYSKSQRKTGKVGGLGSKPNSNKPDDNKGTRSDPRLA